MFVWNTRLPELNQIRPVQLSSNRNLYLFAIRKIRFASFMENISAHKCICKTLDIATATFKTDVLADKILLSRKISEFCFVKIIVLIWEILYDIFCSYYQNFWIKSLYATICVFKFDIHSLKKKKKIHICTR